MAGQIKISSLKIGNMDLTNPKEVTVAGFNIYEDILNPYGPVSEIRVIDPTDALSKNNITGSYDQDVEINISPDDTMSSLGGGTKLKLKMYKNHNLDDQSFHNTGSGHHKQYTIRAVSPELLHAQGNYIEKSFNGKTSDIIEHVLDKGFKTKRQKDITKTKGKRRIVVPKSHPLDVIKNINSEHVSEKHESSTFVLFQQGGGQGEHKYAFKTFEELFEQSPVVKLTQTTNLNFDSKNQKEKQDSIIWFKPSSSFFSGNRALSKTAEYTVDLTTHKVTAADPNKSNRFKFADNSEIYGQNPSYVDRNPPVEHYIHDKANNKEKHETSKAKTKRADYLAKLSQTSAELEVYYNPKIAIGKMIELSIPKKADSETDQGEKQWNGKCLVVAMRTKFTIAADPPKCTMILRVVKGNSYKEGGGGQG